MHCSRIVAVVVPFLLAGTLLAQSPDTATVRGTVTDATHAAVQGARVTATNTQTGLQRVTQSDATGRFSIPFVPVAGAYRVEVTKDGFASATLKDVRLMSGTSADLTIQLNPSLNEAQVTVTGVVGQVRADEPQIGDRLGEETVQEIPVLNRRISFLPLLNAANRPALNQGDVFMNQNLFTTNGAGRRQTWFEVDGSSGIDMWGRQTLFTNLPLDSVQEMQVLTNAFSAEYGGTTGGVVNIVTRTGGNAYHGDLLALFRPAGLGAALSGYTAATAPNGNAITGDSLKQTAGMFSGPLLGNQTHFAVAGEYSWQDRVSPVSLPIAGAFEGHYRGGLAFTRIDHQFNQRHTLFFRANADVFRDTNPNGAVGGSNLPSADRVFRRKTYTVELGETAVLSARLLNDARVHFDLASPITEFDPVTPSTQYIVPIGAARFTSGTSQSAKLLNHQVGITDTFSAMLGKHALRVGGSVLHAHNGGNSKEFGGPPYLGVVTYKACTLAPADCFTPAFLNNIANVTQYTQGFGNANYRVDDTLWALFAQDDFHATKELTLNFGLRYERQTLTGATRDFAPRTGFAYDLFGNGRTVLRGSYGIYYSTVPDNSAANWALTGPTGVFNYTATPGGIGFPTSLTSVPLPAFPAGAQLPPQTLYLQPGRGSYYDRFLPTSTLIGYQNALLNPYSQQWTLGVERGFAQGWVLTLDYVGSHTLRIVRPLDVNPPTSFVRTAQGQTRSGQAANCTRPYWVWWYAQQGLTCNPAAATNPQPRYGLIQSDVNDGYAQYNAFDVNLRHSFSTKFEMLVSYTWSHALSNVDPDIPGQNPNDPRRTGKDEYGPSIFDQRHRLVVSGVYVAPFNFHFGGVVTLGSGLPYNITTGTTNSGDAGATADRPVVSGVVIGRNAGRGRPIYEVSPFLERDFALRERMQISLRAEAFNLFNHANFVGYNSVYGNGAAPPASFGTPAVGITNQLPARSFQISGKLKF